MKRFKFTLQRVLDLRAHREDEAAIELGRAMSILAEIENRIKTCAEERVRAASERFRSSNRATDILAWENYILRLDAEKERLLEEAAQAELAVEEKRNAYIEASREKKVLDKVREKRFKEYRRISGQEEIKTVDDISGGVVSRRELSG
jgi:flagellar FliJ protein